MTRQRHLAGRGKVAGLALNSHLVHPMKTKSVRRVILGMLSLAVLLVSSCETVVYHPVPYTPKKSQGGVTSGGSVRGPVNESVNFQ
jgi:hypothetical protein